jgi:sugar-specific transcriptional regulator TrmB
VSDDKTDDILGELHEAHTQPSSPEIAATVPPPEEPPAWFTAFEDRLAKQVAAALYDYEEKLTRHQESRYQELRERQRAVESKLDRLKESVDKLTNAVMGMHHMLEQGENKLRDDLSKHYRELAHRLTYPDTTERNGGAGSV